MKNSKWLVELLGWFVVLLLLTPVSASAKEGGGDFSREELTQMLAPVALYPDALLSQVLMGATYPLEVVEADRWIKRNPLLKGDKLDDALQDQDWDPSVKALCHVPTVLGLMSERLEETTRLGDAFLAQEQEVMDTVQDLRLRAMREGNLKSDDKQKVTVLKDGTIVIEPADPEVVYVPYYNTRYVYGPWWYEAWPPWYWGPGEVVVGTGVYFWPEFYFGFGFGFGYWSHFDWPRRTIIIDVHRRPRFFRPDYDWDRHRGGWRHEPRHRRGVVYRDPVIAERFVQPPERVKQAERKASRDKVVRGPGVGRDRSAVETGGRGKAGDIANAAERKKIERAPGSVGDASSVGPTRGRGEGQERRRPERERVAPGKGEQPSPVVEAPRRVEPAPPVRERRDGGESRRETTRTREPVAPPDRPAVAGEERGYDRRGGPARERGGQGPIEEEGRGDRGERGERGGLRR